MKKAGGVVSKTSREFGRLTVVEMVHHLVPGEQIKTTTSRFARRLQTDEQSFERKFVVGDTWQPLDCGWVPHPSMLVLKNEEGRDAQVNPSPAEKEDLASRVVEVSYTEDDRTWLILPGESMRACPSAASLLKIRCQNGIARCTIVAVPN